MILERSFKFNDNYAWLLMGVMVTAFVSLFFSFQFGFFIFLFLITAWWTWNNPEESFLFFLIIAPILPMLKTTNTIGTFTLIKDVIIITLFLKTFAIPLLSKKLPYRNNILFIPILLLFLWTAVGILRADNPILGVLRARDIILYTLLYFAVLYLPHTKQIMITRLKWILTAAVVVMSLGIYQWFFAVDSAVLRYDPVREIWIPRISGVLAHPSIYGQYLLTIALLALGGFLAYRSSKKALFLLFIFLAAFPLIFLTYSRAVWLGLFAGILAIITALLAKSITDNINKKLIIKTSLALLIPAAIAGYLLFTFTPINTYLQSAIDPTYASNQERLIFLARLIAPLSDTEAIIGRGLGDVLQQNFRETNISVYDIASGSSRDVQLTKNSTLVDNQYLKTFIESGLTGLLIYFTIFLILLKKSFRYLKTNSCQAKTICLWGIGFVFAFATQALFIDIWDIFPTNAFFWIIAALISAAPTIRTRHM